MRQYAARSDAMASRYAAAQTRLRMFEEAGPPPEPPRKQDIKMRLRGGRTGLRADHLRRPGTDRADEAVRP